MFAAEVSAGRKVRPQRSTTTQRMRAPGSARASAAREPEDAAGAAEAEDGQALQIAPEPEPLLQQRVERRRRDPGGRDDDQPVDVHQSEATLGKAVADGSFGEVERGIDIEAGSLRPAMRCEVPVERNAGVSLLDPGVPVDLRQPRERLGAPGEEISGVDGDGLLVEDMLGNGGREREQARHHGGGLSGAGSAVGAPMPPHPAG
jgi:hypothetical protein